MPDSIALRLALAAAALAVVAAGLLIGRATAGGAPPAPAFSAARTSAAALALPQLSQAAPLPALRPRGASVKRSSTPTVPTVAAAKPARPHAKKPAHKAAPPHRVVGSG